MFDFYFDYYRIWLWLKDHGEWTLEQVQREAEHLFKLSEKMYTESKLPKRPDREKVSKLCQEIIEMSWTREW